jgi:hypothetical protein
MTEDRTMLRNSLALLLAVRCKSDQACLQLLAGMYNEMEEQQVKQVMLRLIYLLTPSERDWLRGLA